MRTTGLILIVIGLIMSVFTGFTLITQKKVIDIGKLEINREEKTPIYWSPITGLLLVAAGGFFYFAGKKRS